MYDTYRQPHLMTTAQRQYWAQRSPALRTSTTTTTRVQPNWSGFNRRTTTYTDRQAARQERQTARQEREAAREQRQQDRQLRKNNPGY